MEQLLRNLSDLSSAVNNCVTRNQQMPALILLYSAIDIVSSLDRAGNKGRDRFIRWVDTYLLPGTSLKCTAFEIYAARCGVVHTMTSESDLSLSGKHRKIWYAWGNRTADELARMIDQIGRAKEGVAVHISELYEAFLNGAEKWAAEVKADSQRRLVVERQGQKWFVNIQYQAE